MLIAHSVEKLHTELDRLRYAAGTRRCVSLITTHGQLHEGHGAVINAAKTVSDVVVVAIIPEVETDDRVISANEFHDIGFVEKHGADLLFVLQQDYLLCAESRTQIKVQAPFPEFELDPERLRTHLCVLNAVQPEIMVWGERNFVEYATMRQLLQDLSLRTQLQCVPTVRHADGVPVATAVEVLAAEDRARLPVQFETLRNASHAIRAGARNWQKVENTARLALKGANFEVDYFRILDESTLQSADDKTAAFRIVTQARINGIPLMDSLGLAL